MKSFSPQLTARLQRHFKERFNLDITVEQANEYLHTFAELFLVFYDPPD